MKILKSVYILVSYISFANSYFHSSVSKWSLPLGESWRRILQNASSLCIKSLHQVIISTILTKQLHRVIHIKSWYQVSISSFSCQVFISILCIKSLHHIFMFSLFIKSLYKVFVSRPCTMSFSSSLCIKSSYQDLVSSCHIKSLYQVFISSLRIKVFVSKSSYQVFVSCLNYWLNKFCKRMLKSSRSFAILQSYFSLRAKKYLF